jgi:hypothetical protein
MKYEIVTVYEVQVISRNGYSRFGVFLEESLAKSYIDDLEPRATRLIEKQAILCEGGHSVFMLAEQEPVTLSATAFEPPKKPDAEAVLKKLSFEERQLLEEHFRKKA